MRKLVVAGVIAAASVLSLAGCGSTTATTSDPQACQDAYKQEKIIATELRKVVVVENRDLAAYVEGTMSADDLATELDNLTTRMHALNADEDNINSDPCTEQ